jgi:hypothetical protein
MNLGQWNQETETEHEEPRRNGDLRLLEGVIDWDWKYSQYKIEMNKDKFG